MKINDLFEFLQEDNGGPSMARLIPFMMCVLYFIQGISQIIRVGEMSMDWNDLAAVMGPFVVKAYQKQFEEKSPHSNRDK